MNDSELQAEYWRNQNAAKAEQIEELEKAVEWLEKDMERIERAMDGDRDASDISSRSIDVEATFYTARCEGCTGITKTGIDVMETIYTPDGKRIIAVDPSILELGTLVKVTLENGDSFEARAEDTGGAIKGSRIDILVESRDEAYRLGKQSAKVEIISEGD